MAPTKIEWVCQFKVEDPQRHRKGFTIYKLTSVVFPRNSPEAGTKLIIWKRFNDFKQLYNTIRESCKLLNLASPPAIAAGSFFKRFEEDVIKERVRSSQALLNFIGENKILFLGEEFRKFCERGYKVGGKGKDMGQGESVSYESHPDVHLNDKNSYESHPDVHLNEKHWRWSDDPKYRSEASESSDDESGAASTESGASTVSPAHNNNLDDRLNAASNEHNVNNNVTTPTPQVLPCQGFNREDSAEVLDVAGGGGNLLSGPSPQEHTEVVCRSERPVAAQDVWLALPPAEQRLAAYRVVAVMDPILVVVHSSRPQVRLALKVMRKSSWPVAAPPPVGEPRPVPHMVRLIDWIETDDAVFVITELVTGGRLFDHARRDVAPDHTPDDSLDRVQPPSPNLDVDALVQHAQRLLASVSRTLERSAAQQQELKTVESALDKRGRKPRSKSVLPRARLERRFSSDDATGPRPRTAHASLERVARGRVSRAPESSVREWGAALVASLDTLHLRGLIWRDLHHGNVLWGPGGRLVVSFQHRWSGVEPPLHSGALASLCVAPEVLSVFPVSPACDWWSVGVLLYDLLTGVPLVEVHPNGLSTHSTLELPDFLSLEARSLLSGLLEYEPSDRLGSGTYGSEEIKCHAFFCNVDWERVYNDP